ncbi:hypothetical protein CK203_031047 [Vitis vinifera]|uniref:Retrovirus-related Pol polyprotein from transposon 17.6 n=1 Tax=Vitis vinifera TaxID=29760 RepID=A0A438I1G3_VITVI|nr:hypothetical protein CK203_031047 [Vitis vinifera]
MIVKSRGRSDHLAALERFFERIRQFRLRLNPKKCTFGVTSGKLLGYMVSERGIEVDPDKIRAILTCLHRGQREVRGFLGRLQYISRFIARLTDICEPIFRLLRKSQPTVWDDQCQRAFERIRTQLDDSGKDRAIYYLSKRMLDYETRYVMIERYAWHWPALVGRLMRWLVLLTEFDIHYVTQKSIRGSIVADHLASLPVSDARAIDDDFPDEDVAAVTSLSGWRISVRLAFSDRHPPRTTLLSMRLYLGVRDSLELGIRQMEVFGDSNLLLVARFEDLRYTHLPRAQNQFADALATLASMIDIPADATVRPLLIESRSAPAYCCLIDDMEIDDGLPWYHDIYHFLRLGVYPEAATAKDRRIETVGHPIPLLPVRSEMSECQIHGDLIHVPPSELHALTSPWPFSVWGIDIIGKISPKSSSGHEFILVAIDYFTKWVEAASYARLTSSGVARATPYSLVYGMEAVLPVEIEMGSLRVALEQQIPETDWAQARFDQLNLLDERRLRAADHVRAYQRKMARAFKKRVKPRPLHVGDLVLRVIRGLIRDPRGKFRPSWSGPYFIRELTLEGAAWLMDLDGNQFSEPTNVDQLKRGPLVDAALFRSFTSLGPRDHPEAMGSDIVFYGFYVDRITCLMRDDSMSPVFPEVTCSRIDDSMLSDLRPILHFDAIQGHISVRMRFTDHEGVACLSLFARSRFILFDIVVIPGWGYLRCMDFPRHHFSGPWRRSFSHMSITASITRPRYIVFASLTIIPELFIDRALSGASFETRRSGVQSRRSFTVYDIQSRILGFDVQSRYHFSIDIQSHILVSAFRVVITSQFDVQNHHHHFSVSAFRAIIGFQIDIQSPLLGFGVQSRYRFSASVFRAIITTSLSFGVQSRHRFSDRRSESRSRFRRSESLSLLSFGVQSRHRFSDRRSESRLRFRRSESLSLLSLTFRVIIITSQFRRSELSLVFRSTVRVASSVSAFRVVITSQFDVQSHHHHFLVSTSRSIIIISLRLPESLLSSCLGFQSHHRHLV